MATVSALAPPPDDELRGSIPLADSAGQPIGCVYAEVACGDTPNVSCRLPVGDDGWVYWSADEAIAIGTLLTRIGGAAKAYRAAEAEFADDGEPDDACIVADYTTPEGQVRIGIARGWRLVRTGRGRRWRYLDTSTDTIVPYATVTPDHIAIVAKGYSVITGNKLTGDDELARLMDEHARADGDAFDRAGVPWMRVWYGEEEPDGPTALRILAERSKREDP